MTISVLKWHWGWCSQTLTSEVPSQEQPEAAERLCYKWMLCSCEGSYFGIPGVSFVFQVRRLPSEEGAFCGWWGKTRPDIAFLPLQPPLLLAPEAPSTLSSKTSLAWVLELCGEGEKGASHLPAQGDWGHCFLCCVPEKTIWPLQVGEVPRLQALVAFCIHFSGFWTGRNLAAEVRKQGIRLIFTAQLLSTLQGKGAGPFSHVPQA